MPKLSPFYCGIEIDDPAHPALFSYQVAHMSLIPDLTPHENERVILNSVRYAAQVAANILAYLAFLLLLGVDSGKNLPSIYLIMNLIYLPDNIRF